MEFRSAGRRAQAVRRPRPKAQSWSRARRQGTSTTRRRQRRRRPGRHELSSCPRNVTRQAASRSKPCHSHVPATLLLTNDRPPPVPESVRERARARESTSRRSEAVRQREREGEEITAGGDCAQVGRSLRDTKSTSQDRKAKTQKSTPSRHFPPRATFHSALSHSDMAAPSGGREPAPASSSTLVAPSSQPGAGEVGSTECDSLLSGVSRAEIDERYWPFMRTDPPLGVWGVAKVHQRRSRSLARSLSMAGADMPDARWRWRP